MLTPLPANKRKPKFHIKGEESATWKTRVSTRTDDDEDDEDEEDDEPQSASS